MNQPAFNEYTFQQALARARAREAAELAAAAAAIEAGNRPKPSRDIGDMLRQQALDRLNKVLSGAFFPGRKP